MYFYVLFTDIDGRINAALRVEGTSGCRSTIFLTSKNKTPEQAYLFRGDEPIFPLSGIYYFQTL